MSTKHNLKELRKKRIINLISSRFTPIVSLIILILVIVSCATMDANKATLVLNISSSNQAKTLLPDIDMEHAGYDFAGTGPGGATFSLIDSQPPLMASNLEPGDWTITVNAKNAAGIVIGMGEQTITLYAGQTQTLNIMVTPLDGYGALDLVVNWTAEDTDNPSIEAQLYLLQALP